MILLDVLARALLLPAAASLAVLLASRPWPAAARSALALAAGYATAHVAVLGWPSLPPAQVSHTFLPAAALATILAIAEPRFRPATARAAHGLLAFALAFLLVRPIARNRWTTFEATSALVLVCAVLLLFRESVARLSHRLDPRAPPVLLALLAAGGSAALFHSASVVYAHLHGAIAAALLASLAARGTTGPSSLALPTLLLPAIWVAGTFYARLPVASGLFLAVTPAAIAAASRMPSGTAARRGAIAAAALLPVAAAVAIAILSAPPGSFP